MTIYPSDRVTSGRSAMGASPAALAAVQAALAANTAADAANTAADAANAALDALQATDIAALLALAHPPASIAPATNPALSLDTVNQVFNLDLTTPGSYDNTASGLTADNIQGALDELATLLAASALEIQDHNTTVETNAIKMNITGNTVQVSSIAPGELKISVDSGITGSYDNTTSGLLATSIQSAIDELALYPKGAFNGTSVDTTTNQVQLGNDVGGTNAALQNDREIPLNGHKLYVTRTDGGLPTVLQEDGTMQIGYNLVIKGDYDGATNTGNVLLRVGDDTDPIRQTSIIQQAGIDTATGNLITENKTVDAVNQEVRERVTKPIVHDVRGYKATNTTVKNLVGSSPNGDYYLGVTGWDTNSAVSNELPVTSSAGTVDTLGVDTTTGQIVRKQSVDLTYRKVDIIYDGDLSTNTFPTVASITNLGGWDYYDLDIVVGTTQAIPFAAPAGKKWVSRISQKTSIIVNSPKNEDFEAGVHIKVDGVGYTMSEARSQIVPDTGSVNPGWSFSVLTSNFVADVNQTVGSTSPVLVHASIIFPNGTSVVAPAGNGSSDRMSYCTYQSELYLVNI